MGGRTVVCDGVGACHFGWLVGIGGGVFLFVRGHVFECDICRVSLIVWTVTMILVSSDSFKAKSRVHNSTQ